MNRSTGIKTPTTEEIAIFISPETNLWNKLALGMISQQQFQFEMEQVKNKVTEIQK